MSHQGNYFKQSLGFTLVEVMIAVGLFATLSVLVQSSWSGNYQRFKKSKIKVQAVELLQRKILEVEIELKTNGFDIPLGKQSGKFDSDKLKYYSWEWEAKKVEVPDLSALVPTDGENTLVLAVLEKFREYLNESLTEVKVSVLYQRNKKDSPLNFSVPLFLVDYDQEMQIGLPGSGPATGVPGAR